MKQHTPSLVEVNTALKYQRRTFLNLSLQTMATSGLMISHSMAEENSPPNEAVIVPEVVTEASAYYQFISSYNDRVCLRASALSDENSVPLNLQRIKKQEYQQWKVTYLGQKNLLYHCVTCHIGV